MPKFEKKVAAPKAAPAGPPQVKFTSRHANHVIRGGPEKVVFVDGKYQTAHRGVIEFLRGHADYDVTFTEVDKPKAEEPAPNDVEEGEDGDEGDATA